MIKQLKQEHRNDLAAALDDVARKHPQHVRLTLGATYSHIEIQRDGRWRNLLWRGADGNWLAVEGVLGTQALSDMLLGILFGIVNEAAVFVWESGATILRAQDPAGTSNDYIVEGLPLIALARMAAALPVHEKEGNS